MDTRSVIVAVASPPGHSPRGIVRLSGEASLNVVTNVLDPCSLNRGVHVARLRAPAPACACLLLVMPGPASATGEDCVEVHLPGNPALLERVVDALIGASDGHARRAGPGEFSARAVLNGRMNVAQADRVAAAIAAQTDAQLHAADALAKRAAGARTSSAADEVATLLALVEAGIDFTDQEDVSAIAPDALRFKVQAVIAALQSQALAGSEAASVAPIVVLGGPPNAGKSSLFNALLGRTRAVAAPLAGTTRDVLREPLELPSGHWVILVDAPGLEPSKNELDVLVQQQAEDVLQHADVLLWCSPAGQLEHSAPDVRAAVLPVKTMCDRSASTPFVRELQTSAHTSRGLDALRTAIDHAVQARAMLHSAAQHTLGSAQRDLAAQAVLALQEASRLASTASPGARQIPHPELVAASLRTALDRLGEIAGAIPPDDVLGRLFARFCVGK